MVEIAHFDGWTLHVQPWADYTEAKREPWWRVYLFKDEGKGRFYLAWNGSRFAKSGELARASKAAPDALWRAQEHLLGAFTTAKCSRAHALHTHARAA